ncbi:hypothetical protein Jann_3048 [Jannaschia sp. CCS1]|nr:hypothetical protein Jann_3048 [Jannaschia sp. CCS1]
MVALPLVARERWASRGVGARPSRAEAGIETHRIAQEVEDLIVARLRGYYLVRERPSFLRIWREIRSECETKGVQLERHQKTLNVAPWLVWFAKAVLEAQQVTLDRVGFFIAKAHFYDRHREVLNDRQAKVIERMFREGLDGFKGGLSAETYISISGTSRATATRDLRELVELGAVTRTGERRYTRYWLNLQGAQT